MNYLQTDCCHGTITIDCTDSGVSYYFTEGEFIRRGVLIPTYKVGMPLCIFYVSFRNLLSRSGVKLLLTKEE